MIERLNLVDEELFSQFILEVYEQWLHEFEDVVQDRINHCAEEHVADHLYQQMKIRNELDNVRGLY